MARVRVGVKRITKGDAFESDDGEGIELTQQWVEIDGVRLSAVDNALQRVSYDVEHVGGAGVVTVQFLSEGFETVDSRTSHE